MVSWQQPLALRGNSSLPNTYKTTDNENFESAGATPSQVNHLVWQGLPGVYLAATPDGLMKTVDGGATWDYLRPNATFGGDWPGGAVGKQVAFAIGPRTCPTTEEPPSDDCEGSQLFMLSYDSAASEPSRFFRLANGSWSMVSDLADYQDPHWVQRHGDKYYVVDTLNGSSEDGTGYGGGQLLISDDAFATVNVSSSQVIYTYSVAGSRIWAFRGPEIPSENIAYSDDDGVTWIDSRAITDVDNFGHIAASGSKIAAPWITNSDILMVEVSIDNGATWNSFPITEANDNGDFYAPNAIWAYWLPSGRLAVVYKKDNDIDTRLFVSYSDDNGVTWTDVEITPIESGFSGLLEVVATDAGALFILVNQGTGQGVWRSGGGATSWEVIDFPVDAEQAYAITFENNTETLYGRFDGGAAYHVFSLANALTGTTWEELPYPIEADGLTANNLIAGCSTGLINWHTIDQEQSPGFSSDLDFSFTNPQDGTYLVMLPVVMYQNSGAAPATPVPTGDLTWTLVDDIGTADSNGNRVLLWWAEMLASDPASINVVVPASGDDVFYRGSVAFSKGFNTTTPIVQTVTAVIPVTGATATLDLDPFASPANYGFTVGFDTDWAVTDWEAIAVDPTLYDVPAFFHQSELDAVWDCSEPNPAQLIAVELAVL